MSEDTKLKELIINTLSPEQMPEVLSDTEIYLVEDDAEYATVEELATHTDNTTIHVTEQDKTTWNGKQDKPTITKSSNNQNGIIQYSDGRMEQWGIATSSTTGETEFTMNNSFVDTNFQVFIEPRQAGDLVHYAIPSATNKFKARIQNTSGSYMTCQFQWRAYGFWK